MVSGKRLARNIQNDKLSLKAFEWKRFIKAPDLHLLDELYVPALSRAVRYDRCCAYFSSQVLSVAARGFGGLIENLLSSGGSIPKPAIRLLVNEQLEASDLDALMATGDQSKLIDKLLKQFKTPQDALERNRLQMLAWLIASGWLEVRIGVMRRSGGILHAKFGIVTDANSDHIAFMGSSNETGVAIRENYEELEVRSSWHDPEFVENYQNRFDTLWRDRDENVMTLPLPEAVMAKMIKLAPKKPPKEMRQDRQTLANAMLWNFIAQAPYMPNGEHACDATAMVDLWPHQRKVVEDTSKAFPSGRLLCDEVGMGKTIEAILILRRLLCGRGVKRALLLVPAGLLEQWQDELREKGGLLIPRWENSYIYMPNGKQEAMEATKAMSDNNVLILSREWARLENNRNLMMNVPEWDLVLLDEAHAARRSKPEEREFNSGNLLLSLLRELQLRKQARGILLLSATPMQTQPWEPWDLLSVLGIGGKWAVEFKDIREYYSGVQDMEFGNSVDIVIAGKIADMVSGYDEFPDYSDSDLSDDPDSLGSVLAFATSDDLKKYAHWLRYGAPLGKRMHRNTRDTLREYYRKGLLDYPCPERQVEDIDFDYQDDAERDCYNSVGRYIEERYDQLEKEKPGKGFVMTIYRRRAASSPLALRRSLERRLEKLDRVISQKFNETWMNANEEQLDIRDLSDADVDEEIDPALPSDPKIALAEKKEIRSLLDKLEPLGGIDSKFDAFWSVLRDISADGRSVLVFTEYADTMKYLRDQLCPNYGMALGCYSGSGGQVLNGGEWINVSKSEITERLNNGKLSVLVCTDAASEGLNLQSASALINYDLPWNPSKVEQRIGRIDRIGQLQHILPIRNLFLRDSVDMRVYQALRRRCGLFIHFVGKMQPVLAFARDILRRSPKRNMVFEMVKELDQKADEVSSDNLINSVYSQSEADELPPFKPSVARQDIETALRGLSASSSKVKAKQTNDKFGWRLTGLGKQNVTVTVYREALESDKDLTPLTLGSEILNQIAETQVLTSSVPLVIGEHSSGAYRCAEARWISGDKVISPESAEQLVELINSWDGSLPNPSLVRKAYEDAKGKAKLRVEEMRESAKLIEASGLKNQLESARFRLMRELGRTLRCISTGELGSLLREQVRREQDFDGRYHRALKLLGDYPVWNKSETEAIDYFVNGLKESERRARLLGSEIDAALDDPRWVAAQALTF